MSTQSLFEIVGKLTFILLNICLVFKLFVFESGYFFILNQGQRSRLCMWRHESCLFISGLYDTDFFQRNN